MIGSSGPSQPTLFAHKCNVAANRHRYSHQDIIYQRELGGGEAPHRRTVSRLKFVYYTPLIVACSLLSYDATTGLILIVDEKEAVIVDVSLCVNPWSSAWARDDWVTVMAIGYLESSLVGFCVVSILKSHNTLIQVQLPIPTIPGYAPAPDVNPRLILRAILVTELPEFDQNLWNSSLEEREELLASL